MLCQRRLGNREVAAQLMQLFVARTDVYGVESEKGWRTVKESLTIRHVTEHLEGKYCLGVYPFNEKGIVKWICIDIDFKRSMLAYNLARQLFHENCVLLEDTGGRGMHVWILLEPTPLWQANMLVDKIKSQLATEIFPKQRELKPGQYGNFVRLPLGIHHRTGNRSYFLQGPPLAKLRPYQTCRHLIYDQNGNPNCFFRYNAPGFCTFENCPIKGGGFEV